MISFFGLYLQTSTYLLVTNMEFKQLLSLRWMNFQRCLFYRTGTRWQTDFLPADDLGRKNKQAPFSSCFICLFYYIELKMMEEPLARTTNQDWKDNNLDTDSSLNRSQGPPQEKEVPVQLSKKRIGPYSYKLCDVIGSGFSSVVYKGCKDNDKSQVVAIKVVQLKDMPSHRRQLLQKEITILKTIDHPNTLTFTDLYWTVNNCYIITEYCQGGNLQHLLQKDPNFDWRQAAYEVSIASQYLASLNIIHRDIKPANVLIKNGIFKLSDFGFSLISANPSPIQERYLIGSPLYMPPESLKDHRYSSKSDSFGLGVLLYFMATKRYPWKGKNKKDLIASYSSKKYSKSSISHLPPRVKHLLHSLLQLDHSKRAHLRECDFSVFLHLGPLHNIQSQEATIRGCFEEQVIFCQFINSLKNNAIYFEWANRFLPEFMTRHLGSLVQVFEWHTQPVLAEMSKTFNLFPLRSKFGSDDYYWLNNCLKDTIRELSFQTDDLPLVMLQKLLKYQQIIEAFLFESYQEILLRINQIQLNYNYLMATPDHSYIGRVLPALDFYQL